MINVQNIKTPHTPGVVRADAPCLCVTRPQPAAACTAAMLQTQGYATYEAPVLRIRVLDANALAPLSAAARQCMHVILTSQHAVGALQVYAPAHDAMLWVPGEATADAVRAVGYRRVRLSPDGTMRGILTALGAHLRTAHGAQHVVYLRGTHTALPVHEKDRALPSQVVLHERVVYEALPIAAFSAEALAQLAEGAWQGVLLFSPRSAQQFCSLIPQSHRPHVQRMRAVCLSGAVAQVCEPSWWRSVHVPECPSWPGMMACIQKVWPV